MEHLYSIASLKYVAEKNNLPKVACSAHVYLTSKEVFDYTFDQSEFNQETGETTTTSVTASKTVDNFQEFTVDFDLSSLSSSNFIAWDDLTEDQVIQWVKDAKGSSEITKLETESAAIVARKKDIIVNPLRYQYDSPTLPWVVRAAEAQEESQEEAQEEGN